MPAGDLMAYSLELDLTLQNSAGPVLDDIQEQLEGMEAELIKLGSETFGQLTKSAQRLTPILTDEFKTQKQTDDLLTKESKLIKERFLIDWAQVYDLVLKKTKAIKEEQGLLEKEEETVGSIGGLFGMWGRQIGDSIRDLKAYAQSLFDIRRGIMEAMADTEKFTTANYRFYGSQMEMVMATRRATGEFGLLREEALEAYKVLADVRTPLDQIQKLTGILGQLNRVTGVQIKDLGDYFRRLQMAGYGEKQMAAEADSVAASMRALGLTTQDMTVAMKEGATPAGALMAQFGPDAVSQMRMAKTTLESLGKQAHMSGDDLGVLASMAENSELNLIKLSMFAGGGDLSTIAGRTDMIATAAFNLAEAYEAAGQAGRLNVDAMARASGLSRQQYLDLVALGKEMKAQGKTMEDMGKIYETTEARIKAEAEAMKGLSGIFSESADTVTRQLAMLRTRFQEIWANIGAALNPILLAILKVLNAVVFGIHWLTEQWKKLSESVAPAGKALNWIIGILFVLVGVIVLVKIAMWLLAAQASVATFIGKSFGLVMEHALGGLARGLKALAPYKLELLALAALFLAMGAAAFLFGAGIALVAREGDRGLEVLKQMTIAMILLGIVLVILGIAAAGAAPGLFALAAAFLAVGAGAYLFALAAKMVGENIKGLITLAVVIGVLIAVFVALAIIGTFFPPLIVVMLALAIAFLILAVAALVIAAAVWITVQALQMLSPELAGRVVGFFAAFLPAIPILIVVGVLLFVAALAMLPGTILLLIVGILLLVAGVSIMLGGLGLMLGAEFLAIAIAAFGESPPDLSVIAKALGWSVFLLIPQGLALMAAGVAIMIGGFGLMMGAIFLAIAVALFDAVPPNLAKVVEGLGWSVALLIPQGLALAVAATFILIGALALMPAGLLLLIGSIFLSIAVGILAGIDLTDVALDLLEGGFLLLIFGITLYYASVAIYYGSSLLLVATITLVAALIGLAVAAFFADIYGLTMLIFGQRMLFTGIAMAIASGLMVYSMVRIEALMSRVGIFAVYATAVERSMARVRQALIYTLPMLAMLGLGLGGLHHVIAATIATVKVATERPEAAEAQEKQNKLLETQTLLLASIANNVAQMSGAGGSDLADDVGKILEHLRQMGTESFGDDKLVDRFGAW